MPRFVAVCVCVIVAPLVAGQTLQELNPEEFAVGQTGALQKDGKVIKFQVDHVMGSDLMEGHCPAYPRIYFYVSKHSTKGLADRQRIELPGLWKVGGPIKGRGRTLFVLRPLVKE